MEHYKLKNVDADTESWIDDIFKKNRSKRDRLTFYNRNSFFK